MTNIVNDNIDKRVYGIIASVVPEIDRPVEPQDKILDDLGYDSVKVVELAVNLEMEFDLRPITEEDSLNMVTAYDVASLVHQLIGEKAA